MQELFFANIAQIMSNIKLADNFINRAEGYLNKMQLLLGREASITLCKV